MIFGDHHQFAAVHKRFSGQVVVVFYQ